MIRVGNRIQTLCYLLACFYVIIRAWNVGFTHDEALSYQIIQGNELLAATANHHWLNTWLASISYNLPFPAEFALRLPNVIAFIFFGYFIIKLSNQLFKPTLSLGVIFLILGNPFILDYFSLCRGYGLSLTFFLAAISAIYDYYTEKTSKNKTLIFVALYASLGVLSNLNLINVFLLIHLWIGILLLKSFKDNWKLFLGIAIASGSIFTLVITRLFFLRAQNELYFGTNNIETSLDYVLLGSIYSYSSVKYLLLARWLFLILFGLFSILLWYKSTSWMKFISYLSSASIALLILQHYLFDTLYPLDRSAIYFMPVFAFVFALGFQQLTNILPKISGLVNWLFLLLSISFIGINSLQYNVTRTCTWPEYEYTKKSLLDLKNHIHDKKLHELEVSWLYEPIVNFYRVEYALPVHEVFRSDPPYTKEFLLLQNIADVPGYKRIFYYKTGEINVFEKSAQ